MSAFDLDTARDSAEHLAELDRAAWRDADSAPFALLPGDLDDRPGLDDLVLDPDAPRRWGRR